MNVDLYAKQLQRVYDTLNVRYMAVTNRIFTLLQRDNAPVYTAKGKLEEVEALEVLPQSARPLTINLPSLSRHGSFPVRTKVQQCWTFEEVLHFQRASDGQSVKADLYAKQLQRVYNVLNVRYTAVANRICAFLQQDNAPAHTKGKLEELEMLEMLPRVQTSQHQITTSFEPCLISRTDGGSTV